MAAIAALAAHALTLAAGSAWAAPSGDARTPFQAIASGDALTLVRAYAYADPARRNGVGGPLEALVPAAMRSASPGRRTARPAAR